MNKIGWVIAALLICLGLQAAAVPAITHDPVTSAVKGQPLGIRARVHDTSARIETVSLFYAASRGMTPFRVGMAASGAGVWYATIPGHMIGPTDQLLYYIQAENGIGETKETPWVEVKLQDEGLAPANIPSATELGDEARRTAAPQVSPSKPDRTPTPAANTQVKNNKSKYWVPLGIIVGGAAAVGGAYAISESSGGSSGGGGDASITNANYGGSYNICFEPSGGTTTTNGTENTTVCDSGLVNIYVKDGSVQIVGAWGGEVLTTSLNGGSFSAVGTLSARGSFPAAYLIVSGDVQSGSCSTRVDGYSTDASRPGNFTGRLDTTRR